MHDPQAHGPSIAVLALVKRAHAHHESPLAFGVDLCWPRALLFELRLLFGVSLVDTVS